ncbi:hypothetical protein [Mycobacteroides salmoniphilum]|uniref:Uncharacterized protein n=1 Tax=Mycobacteroides salmoniphilum TaxID=404941 RepID=A0A4R8T006_9MYCO|nr:hypothetical protein [Mycobacteroides salmoniphilum]TEA09215.1 hypothetical protein CCUG60884_00205 [Mycobacteroides salmoniphilum]
MNTSTTHQFDQTKVTGGPANSLPIGWLIVRPDGYPDSWYPRGPKQADTFQCPDSDSALAAFEPDASEREAKIADGWAVLLALPTALYPAVAHVQRISA